jgi:hypothetical protein
MKGLRYRKSYKVAPGLRVNVSKSGIGLSGGVRGARLGVGPRGPYMSVGIPGTGLSYYQRLGSSTRSRSSHPGSTAPPPLGDPLATNEALLQSFKGRNPAEVYPVARAVLGGEVSALVPVAALVLFVGVTLLLFQQWWSAGIALSYGLVGLIINTYRRDRAKTQLLAALAAETEALRVALAEDEVKAKAFADAPLARLEPQGVILEPGETLHARFAGERVRERQGVFVADEPGELLLTSKALLIVGESGNTAISWRRVLKVEVLEQALVAVSIKNRKTREGFYLPGQAYQAAALVERLARAG